MEELRIGVIGLGTMGKQYAMYVEEGRIPGAKVTAVTCRNKEKEAWAKANLKEAIAFETGDDLLCEAQVDAVLIATPHNTHPYYASKAFERGLHVLIEKPAGADLEEVEAMNRKAEECNKVFGIMFDRRMEPKFQRLKEILNQQLLGSLYRLNWITTIYRTQAYYNSNDWRGTWAGEGGGVLLNQAQHHLDIWQWLFGMPDQLRAFCQYGKYHTIEVEDDCTLYMTYPKGLTGVFIASTYEVPGTDRLEIVGEKGRVVLEGEQLRLDLLQESTRTFDELSQKMFGRPKAKTTIENYQSFLERRGAMIENWVQAIRGKKELIAHGAEGIKALLLTQGSYLSQAMDDVVEFPLSEKVHAEIVNKTYIRA